MVETVGSGQRGVVRTAQAAGHFSLTTIQRAVVIGTTGTGKTTFAARLAQQLGYPHVELDALFWEPGWKPAPREAFRERVRAATVGECWIADGNYTGKVLDLLWGRADTIIWLDYSLLTIIWQLFKRTMRRVVTQEELWNSGNRETLRAQFWSRDSLFVWVLQTFGRHRREFPELFRRPEHAHLRIVQLREPGEGDRWLGAQSKGDSSRS